MRFELELKSKLLIGGKKYADNIVESRPDAPGSVVRAALARRILTACPLYDPNIPDTQGKYHQVYLRNESRCGECPMQEACRTFGVWNVGTLAPTGHFPIGLHQRACKIDPSHGLVSMLTERPACVHESCRGNPSARLESATGWQFQGKPRKFRMESETSTAVDRFTQTASSGTLHTQKVIAESGLRYSMDIEGIPKVALGCGDTLHVGRGTSVGLGWFDVVSVRDVPSPGEEQAEVERIVREFTDRYKALHGIENGRWFAALLLKTDAWIPEGLSYNPASSAQYLAQWKALLFGTVGSVRLERAMTEIDIYRGFDTATKRHGASAVPALQLEKGSVFVLSSEATVEEFARTVTGIVGSGIGRDCGNGFGELVLLES